MPHSTLLANRVLVLIAQNTGFCDGTRDALSWTQRKMP